MPSVVAPPASAIVAPTASGSDSLSLTVALAPSNRSGLRNLARQAHGLSASGRRTALDGVAPTTSAQNKVADALTRAGMQVTSKSPWAVQVKATAAQAESLFHVQLTGSNGSLHPEQTATVPSILQPVVASVIGLDQRPLLQPRDLPYGYDPTTLRAAYSVPTVGGTGAGTTVATVQFSGWHSSDLSAYTSAVGQATPSVTQVSVDGANPATPDGHGGDEEVSLDQEMIAAGAPAAAQRIYVAPDTAQGFYDAFNSLATDAAAGRITTASTSWGLCESSASSSLEASVEDAIDRAVVAGATTFASSGDEGAYDCSTSATPDSTLDVDFPAVLPEVVGVGGTTLTASGSTYNESAWSNTSRKVGGGGGTSLRTARPSYQSALPLSGSNRLVPDIAADADPQTGVGIYSTYASGFTAIGGTSASSPLSAAELASTLTSLGCTKGIGDIHTALYQHPGDFRDITTGNNLYYQAGPGYDEATGLGSPDWAMLASDLPTQQTCPNATVTPAQPTSTATPTPAPTSSPTPAPPSTLKAGSKLKAGQYLLSTNGKAKLIMQTDGNFVLYVAGKAKWNTHTNHYPGSSISMQTDGNLVVYDAHGKARWSSRTNGKGHSVYLVVQNDDNVVLYSGTKAVWASRTNH